LQEGFEQESKAAIAARQLVAIKSANRSIAAYDGPPGDERAGFGRAQWDNAQLEPPASHGRVVP